MSWLLSGNEKTFLDFCHRMEITIEDGLALFIPGRKEMTVYDGTTYYLGLGLERKPWYLLDFKYETQELLPYVARELRRRFETLPKEVKIWLRERYEYSNIIERCTAHHRLKCYLNLGPLTFGGKLVQIDQIRRNYRFIGEACRIDINHVHFPGDKDSLLDHLTARVPVSYINRNNWIVGTWVTFDGVVEERTLHGPQGTEPVVDCTIKILTGDDCGKERTFRRQDAEVPKNTAPARNWQNQNTAEKSSIKIRRHNRPAENS